MQLKDIDLNLLLVFDRMLAEKRVSAVAETLGLSQPAVSRSVRELERQLDLRLFHRSTREVVLTEAGQRLAQRLPRWIDELDNMLLELHHWANNRRGKVRVAAAPTLAAALMPACLARTSRIGIFSVPSMMRQAWVTLAVYCSANVGRSGWQRLQGLKPACSASSRVP